MDNILTNGILQLEPLTSFHTEAYATAALSSIESLREWLQSLVIEDLDAAAVFVRSAEQGFEDGTRYCFFVREISTKRCVGLGLINSINKTHQVANLGYWVSSDALGNGYATMITQLLTEFGLETIKLYRLELVIEPDNLGSIRVAQKSGAFFEGTQKRRLYGRDAVVFSIVAQ